MIRAITWPAKHGLWASVSSIVFALVLQRVMCQSLPEATDFMLCAGNGQLMTPDKNSNIPDDLRVWGKQMLEFVRLVVKIRRLEDLEKELKMQRGRGKYIHAQLRATHGGP